MTAPSASTHQIPPTTTLPSSAAAATATTWNPTQAHTIAEYFVNRYNMETIPESLNGELPPLPSHGSRGHSHHNGQQNLHVPKRSNTYTASTSSSSQNRHHQQSYPGVEGQSQQQQHHQQPSLNRSFSSPLSPQSDSGTTGLGSRMIGGGKSTQRVREWVKRSNSSRYVFFYLLFSSIAIQPTLHSLIPSPLSITKHN